MEKRASSLKDEHKKSGAETQIWGLRKALLLIWVPFYLFSKL